MNQNKVRNRYVADGLSNASGIQIIAMLYDRMLRDLGDAENALRNSNWDKVNTSLCHAQDIVIELKACLDPTKWNAGPTLVAIYDYLIDQLIQANVQKDRRIIAECKKVIEPIADAWTQVANQAGADAAPLVGTPGGIK